jgi:cell division protein FtsI/penicillin-binding protein 2
MVSKTGDWPAAAIPGDELMKTEHNWRYTFLGILMSFLPLLIVSRLLIIQANPKALEGLLDKSQLYTGKYITVNPARGQIYDRWGELLAGNKTVYEVGIELGQVRNPESIALAANIVLGMDYNEVLQIAKTPLSKNAVYRVLTNYVPQEKVDRLDAMAEQMAASVPTGKDQLPPSLSGLVHKPNLLRTYPENQVASNILGFVNRDGIGYFGVEGNYNDLLTGRPRNVWVPSDPHQVTDIPDIPPGASLVLTIDREIQVSVENILDNALQDTGAESGTIVVIDPQTGELLAIATTPRLNLNEFWRYGEVFPGSTPFDRAVSQAYEPGSVYKVLTMAAGLDSGSISLDTSFLDTGVFEIGGTYIYNWNGGAWGPQDMQGCMQHSLNVCLAWIASQTGAKNFYKYMNAFGIGRLSGVDLAGEATGRLKVPGDGDWYDADLGTNAFGLGVSATPIQMAAAVSAIANDGKMMAPHVVRSIINKGHQQDIDLKQIGQPIKTETARSLSEMLANSLEQESSDALVDGYRVAGKTGTAEIPTPYGYTSNQTNASFVGWGPVDDPRFLVYVWLEKPQTSIWGSEVAAPVFRDVVQSLVVLMDLPPDRVRLQVYGQ